MKDKKIIEAYNKLVLEINALQKDKDNPYFKSKYVDLNQILDEVKKKVQDAGFSMPQTIKNSVVNNEVKTYLHTELIWIESGEVFLDCDLPLVGIGDMQKLGSAITYARRYSLLPMLQLQCEDDDGNEASGQVPEKKGYDALETMDEFKEAISKAPAVKNLNALYYK
ncbi:MAG: ERF family protein, partial [Prevotella sp.]|nr:ERF family protein [Prevotella sp.]